MEYVEEEFKLDIKEELVENDLSSSRVPIQKIKIEKYEPMNNLIEHNFEIEHVEEEFKLEIKEELVKSEFPFSRVPIQKIKIEKHEPVDDPIVADTLKRKSRLKKIYSNLESKLFFVASLQKFCMTWKMKTLNMNKKWQLMKAMILN